MALRPWACGREFRVDSLSASQHELLEQDGPIPADFVAHDEFRKEEEIPVVDMALFDGDADGVKRNVQLMVAACEEWGYFYLVNHGVELQLMHKVEQQAYEFFSLSTAEKMKHPSQYSLLEKVKRWSEWVAIKPAEANLDEYDNQLSPPDNNQEFSYPSHTPSVVVALSIWLQAHSLVCFMLLHVQNYLISCWQFGLMHGAG
jgi:isopenicillin N synthase-like dioxygenase